MLPGNARTLKIVNEMRCIALYLAIIIIDLFSLSLSLDYRISLPFIFQIVTNECQVPLDG